MEGKGLGWGWLCVRACYRFYMAGFASGVGD